MSRCAGAVRCQPASKSAGYYRAYYDNKKCVAIKLYNSEMELQKELTDEDEIYRFLRVQSEGGIESSTIEIAVYRDSTGRYSEEECNADNIVYMFFQEKTVRAWFDRRHFSEFVAFNRWLYETYTCDDTDGLYNFALSCGDMPRESVD